MTEKASIITGELPLPPGKTRLADGRIIDTIDRVFLLSPSKVDPNALKAIDGTIYIRQKNGSLKRVGPKGKRS